MDEPISINPYAPPFAVDGYEPSPDAPPYQLYSLTAITLGGFLGGTLSAMVLLGLSFFRLNRSTAGYAAVIGGVMLRSLALSWVISGRRSYRPGRL